MSTRRRNARCSRGLARGLARWLARRLALGAVYALLLCGACAPDFEPESLVKDLRVLALKATPPEQVLFRSAAELPPELLALLSGGKLPAQIPGVVPAHLETLIVDPRFGASTAFDWQLWGCSAEERHCDDATYKVQLGSGRDVLSQIAVDVTPAGELFQQALLADTFRGFGGLPVMVELRVREQAGERWVRAIKRLVYTFWLPYSPVPPNKQANVNPELERVTLTIKDADDQDVRKLTLAELTGPLTVRRDHKLVLEPVVAQASKESFEQVAADLDPDGQQLPTTHVQKLEECDRGAQRSTDAAVECGAYFTYYFFATAGALSHGTTGGAPSPFFENKKVDDPTSEWKPPAADKASASEPPVKQALLWLVVSDGRGGVTWTSLQIVVEEPPAG